LCNFVIRPIKSYATVNYTNVVDDVTVNVKRGEFIDVTEVDGEFVRGNLNGDENQPVTVLLSSFVHVFTANADDVKTVKDQEAKWFPKKETKEAKETK